MATTGQTNIDGVAIAHRTIGDGNRNVVFIHGWMMTSAVFDKLIAAMEPDGMRLWLVDLRGAGGSSRDAGGYNLRRYADDVVQVIREQGIDDPVVVGHSMGGQVAQLVAAALGDALAGLALVNTVPLSGLPLPADYLPLFESAASDPGARQTILDHSTLNLSAADKAHLASVTGNVSATCIADSLASWTSGDDTAELTKITVPTLVIATDDGFLPRPFLQQAVVDPITNARLEYIAGAGHYPHVEAAASTAAALQSFLEGQAPS